MPKTTANSSGIAATKISAVLTSMVNAIIIAPKTIKGERKNSLSTILTPVCTWLTSLVSLVMSVETPAESISVKVKELICLKRSFLTPVPNPIAALAANYCAVTELTSPAMPRMRSKKPIL